MAGRVAQWHSAEPLMRPTAVRLQASRAKFRCPRARVYTPFRRRHRRPPPTPTSVLPPTLPQFSLAQRSSGWTSASKGTGVEPPVRGLRSTDRIREGRNGVRGGLEGEIGIGVECDVLNFSLFCERVGRARAVAFHTQLLRSAKVFPMGKHASDHPHARTRARTPTRTRTRTRTHPHPTHTHTHAHDS